MLAHVYIIKPGTVVLYNKKNRHIKKLTLGREYVVCQTQIRNNKLYLKFNKEEDTFDSDCFIPIKNYTILHIDKDILRKKIKEDAEFKNNFKNVCSKNNNFIFNQI